MNARQQNDRERKRDQTQTSLRAIALLNKDFGVDAAPVQMVRGHRGALSYTTLTFHVETAAYFDALRAIKAMEERQAG